MLGHQDVLPCLPDIYNAGVGQEYDCDKPPDQVLPQVLTKRRHSCQVYRIVPQMGLDVAFVESQIELAATLDSHTVDEAGRQGVQSLQQSGNPAQIGMFQYQIPGSALGQHLPYAIPLLLLAVSGLGHLGTEVVRIKDHTIEQESRLDISATNLALVPAKTNNRDAATNRTPLKYHGRVEPFPA